MTIHIKSKEGAFDVNYSIFSFKKVYGHAVWLCQMFFPSESCIYSVSFFTSHDLPVKELDARSFSLDDIAL